MKKLEVRLSTTPETCRVVGHLAEVEHRVYFEYAPEFLQSPLWLSPFKLPPEPGLKEHRDRHFSPLFGLFDDSLPDGWGLLLMDRYFQRQGIGLETVSPLDRLAYLGSRTMGALTYHPPLNEPELDHQILDLHDMAREAYAVLSGESADVLPQLLRAGGSPGGARPKVLVGRHGNRMISGEDELPYGFGAWMVKFHARKDASDDGCIEYAYSQMARAAGVQMPTTELLAPSENERFFAVSRFDRQGRERFHVHTFGNLIHADFRIPSCDYEMLLKVTRVLTKNQADVRAAFRLAVFNALAHNRDDHCKNFAFILHPDTGWQLAPAYDLTFSPGPGGEHSTTYAGEGKSPAREHFLKLAGGADIAGRDADNIIDEVAEAVAGWGRFAEAADVTASSRNAISNYLELDLMRL